MKRIIYVINLIIIYMFIIAFNSNVYALSQDACLNMTDDLLAKLETGQEKITYECFGAKGDGKTNDYVAIKKAHDFANNEYANKDIFLTVHATEGKTYYLGSNYINGKSVPITVATSTNFHNANFIVDDNNNVDTDKQLFTVVSPMYLNTGNMAIELNSNDLAGFTIKKDEKNIKSFVTKILNKNYKHSRYLNTSSKWALDVFDSNIMYIRSGGNQNNGENQRETIIIDKDTGNILSGVDWNYNNITKIRIFPIPNKEVVIENGNFTTYTFNQVALSDGSKHPFVQRNIYVSYTGNVTIRNINHYLKEDAKPYSNQYQAESNGNRYYGFIRLFVAAYVNLDNLKLTPHTYATNKKIKVSEGTYDLVFDNTSNISLNKIAYACNEYRDGKVDYNSCYSKKMINKYVWGITGTNASKNVMITNSTINRIDAHRGITNVYVADSTIGSRGIGVIGKGYFYAKNLKIDRANHVFALRDDYGSSWDGTVVLNNIKYVIKDDYVTSPAIISTNNNQLYYGYTTYFPNIYIKDLTVDAKTYGSTKNTTILKFNNDTSPNGKSKYSLYPNIRMSNINSNDSRSTLYLFEDAFVNNTNNIKLSNYSDNKTTNIGYNTKNSNFKIVPSTTNLNKLKDRNINDRFSFNDSDSTDQTVNNQINTVETFFNNLKIKLLIGNITGKIYLKSISINDGAITTNEKIEESRTNYTITVNNNVKSLTINPIANDNNIKITGNTTINLGNETTNFTINLSDCYGNSKTYTFKVSKNITSKSESIAGDVDGNGKVGSSDYVLVRKHILKQTSLTGDKLKRADVNNDGKVNAQDYVMIRKSLIKKLT